MECKIESIEELETENEEENETEIHTMPVPDAVTIATEYHDYVEEMNNFITSHVQVSNSNAIELNEKFRSILIDLSGKLEKLRKKCVARYEANAEELKKSKKKMTLLRGRFASYSSCGQPYFKNRNFYKAPPNHDYVFRKSQYKELFPIDLDYTFGHWTIHDKTTLIFGVKEQLINHLEACNVESRNILRNTRLADLYKIGELFISSFQINWNKIVLENLKERHNVPETTCMWNEYLHPHTRRGPWTSVEDTRLLHAAKKFNFQNWYEISKMVPNRSKLQCMVHCHCVLFDRLRTRHTRWTKEEDMLLLSLVKQHSIGKYIPWTKVTEKIPYRTKIQVYHRYIYSLNPEIVRSRFTPEEDCVLLAAIQQYGKNYCDIPNDILPGRTQSQIRQRYNNVLKHSGKIKHWTVDDDAKLMALVKKYGTKSWAEISLEISNHTRVSCRTRYTVIKQYLDKNPTKSIINVPRKKRMTFSQIGEDNWLETLVKLKNDVEINQNSIVKCAPGFFNKLNAMQLSYFNFFKYSYSFKYDSNPYGNFNMQFIQKNFMLYSKFLDFDVNLCHSNRESNDMFNSDYMFNPFENLVITELRPLLYNFMDILFMENLSLIPPPSWNSMMLYRNLLTFSHRHNELDETDQDKETQTQKVEHTALAKFRKRLALLLYYPYLLSKCSVLNYIESSTLTAPRQNTTFKELPNAANTFTIEYITEDGNKFKRQCEIEDMETPIRKKNKK